MATPAAPVTLSVGPDTFVTVKVLYNDSTRRFKIPLRDLGARVFPQTIRQLLDVPADASVVLERYSDSAASYIRLDSDNIAVYKQLYRAAKAKLKLRIKATVVNLPRANTEATSSSESVPVQSPREQTPQRGSYLDTVLSPPLQANSLEARLAATDSATRVVTVASHPAHLGQGQGQGQPVQWQATGPTVTQPHYREFVSSPEYLNQPFVSHTSSTGAFCIDCNHCGGSIPNDHYHCGTCDNGDYDLCLKCVDAGVTCPGTNHWLIKRTVKDGTVTASVTEVLPPRGKSPVQTEKQLAVAESNPVVIPVALPVQEKVAAPSSAASTSETVTEERICNCCLKDFPESKMVTCVDCEDYDLCQSCLLKDAHGHHPAHSFKLIHGNTAAVRRLIVSYCKPGRRYQHAALCDGCDKRIIGVRHKCLTCPDFDYCAECVTSAPKTHRGHRFVPIYEAIAEPSFRREIHYGIHCDGPLCKSKTSEAYITGVRYKCGVCHDTDFCANCEALPTNTHNRTHPLIKFRTPVRSVTVSTIGDDGRGGQMLALGDRIQHSAYAQTAAAEEPVDCAEHHVVEKEVAAEVQPDHVVHQATPAVGVYEGEEYKFPGAYVEDSEFKALYIRDTIPDNTPMAPNRVFEQTWTLYNPGPQAWPVGCDVRFVGGDSMFNLDTDHPFQFGCLTSAMSSSKLTSPVEAGQSADFTVTLRSPSREGTAISYWRMKLPNGVPFGHRLWCDIQVQAAGATEAANAESVNVKQEVPEMAESTAVESQGAAVEGAGSQMLFPKLEKESPASSIHAVKAPGTGTLLASAPSVSLPSEKDVLEDLDNLTVADADSDEAFMTDEEYDILNASDQDFLEAKRSRD